MAQIVKSSEYGINSISWYTFLFSFKYIYSLVWSLIDMQNAGSSMALEIIQCIQIFNLPVKKEWLKEVKWHAY